MPTPAGHYRVALRHSLARASVPYGYTAMNVAGAGALINTHGAPTTVAALLFLCGAILGFTAVAWIGGDGAAGADIDPRWAGPASGAAALTGFGLAALVAHAIDGRLAFGVAALVSTVAYLLVSALGAALTFELRARPRA